MARITSPTQFGARRFGALDASVGTERGDAAGSSCLPRADVRPGLVRDLLGLRLEPPDQRHPPPASFVCVSLISAPSMPAGRVGGRNRRRTSRAVFEEWFCYH